MARLYASCWSDSGSGCSEPVWKSGGKLRMYRNGDHSGGAWMVCSRVHGAASIAGERVSGSASECERLRVRCSSRGVAAGGGDAA